MHKKHFRFISRHLLTVIQNTDIDHAECFENTPSPPGDLRVVNYEQAAKVKCCEN